MNKAELVQLWIEKTKPINLLRLRETLKKSFGKMSGDPELVAKLQRAVDLLDATKITEIWRTFAEEHFSEDALEAGIEFYSSEIGGRYANERDRVAKASLDAVNRHLLDIVTRA